MTNQISESQESRRAGKCRPRVTLESKATGACTE